MFRAPRVQRALMGALVVGAVAVSCGGRPALTSSKPRDGGAGGASPTGGAGSTGTRQPGAECAASAECAAPIASCEYAACRAGRCDVLPVAAGALAAFDAPADCFDMVCDGAGSAIRVLDLANVPASIDPCAVNECASDGQVSVRPLVAGAPCPMGDGAGLCDGAGTCVGCLVDADCAGAQICGAAHACMPPSCADGARNGAESDVDCGGGACARCGNGRHCTYDADCVSGLCHLSDHVCGAALCTDQRKDGDETDIDCGGSCPPCAASGECRADADCASKACYAGLPHRCLVDHCLDGHQNFDETDRDCGGSTCPGCLDFGKCKVDADCQSDHCDLSQGRHFCLTALCFDGARDQNETDVDCGGNLCVACALGQSCASWFDCASNACDGLSFTCVADHCADHRLDPGEVDVDCGGTCGATCAKGQNCMTSGDCAPGLTCSPWRECE